MSTELNPEDTQEVLDTAPEATEEELVEAGIIEVEEPEFVEHPELVYRWLGNDNYNVSVRWPSNIPATQSMEQVAHLLFKLHSGQLMDLTVEVLKRQGIMTGQQDIVERLIDSWVTKLMSKEESSPIVNPREVFRRISNL